MATDFGQRLRDRAARLTQAREAAGGATRRRRSSLFAIVVAATALVVSGSIQPAEGLVLPAAVLPVLPASTQFDVTGFLQTATVDTPGDPHSGGVVKVNGLTIVIPSETVVILPAAALTWQELFTHAPAPYGPTQTGLALGDNPKPLTTSEFNIIGNRVFDPTGANGCTTPGGCDRYIAGLVHVSQQDLNSATGYINFIDYTTGAIEVGGTLGAQGTGTRVRINDPANASSGSGGRFGRAFSPDDRFQVDQDNPTISAETGFPMCVPRTDPAVTDDALCPQANRPTIVAGTDTSGITPQPNALVAGEFYKVYRMDSPANVDANTCPRGTCADPRKQAPLEIGDYVSVAGNVTTDGGGQYVLAHTIVDSLGVYTQPGIDPVYVAVEVSLIGTGGLTVFGAGEAAARTRFEGMTTDETRAVHLYGVDINVNPVDLSTTTTDRDWGSILPDPGPPNGAVRGRWRFRPPCKAAAVATQKDCVGPAAGQFIPPTREVRAVVEGLQQFLPGTSTPNPASQVPGTPTAQTAANGIFYGQYHAPIGEYIFPENVPGTPVPENNFNTMPFLAVGGYSSGTGVVAGVLKPWPSSQVPNPQVCATASIVGGPYSVANGASIQLSGGITPGATTPVTVSWTAGTTPGGTNLNGALTGANTTTPTFNATGLAAGTYNLTFSATNPCGTSTVATTITVAAAPKPTINPIQNQTVTAGTAVTITGTSNSLPLPTWTWTQVSGPANPALTRTPSAATATATSSLSFTPTVAGTYTFSVTATNANGTSSASTVSVTATPTVPTNVTLNNEYRTGKQRLIITATSTDLTVASMKLQPYQTESGTTFDPTSLGANLTVSLVAPGSFTITLVGAPPPACNLGGAYATPCSKTPITVKSLNVGGVIIGTSPATAMTKIRT